MCRTGVPRTLGWKYKFGIHPDRDDNLVMEESRGCRQVTSWTNLPLRHVLLGLQCL